MAVLRVTSKGDTAKTLFVLSKNVPGFCPHLILHRTLDQKNTASVVVEPSFGSI